MYHYVRDRAATPEAGIRGLDQAAFEHQLDRLCECMTPIDWPTLLAWRANRCDISNDSVLLTFDDCLSDHFEIVAPILESRDLRGVFFVQTQVLAGGKLNPAHSLHLLICRLGLTDLIDAVQTWLDSESPEWRERFQVDHAEAERIYHYETATCAELKHLLTNVLPLELRTRLLDNLFTKHVGDPRAFARRWYMSWNRLAFLQDNGHTVGGHGHQHEPYARLPAPEQVKDMIECSDLLSENLGPMPRPFSYPYGSCSDQIARRCAYSGFVNGFTTENGWIGAFDDAHRLNRVDTIAVDAFLEREFTCIPQ
jgi:peptidoglycan/xylan/chitin deacetylase (PgdA/CDA1 family)